ncbi:hypothetical protein MJO29_012720 [Puccinia striiformis f. sp. tritici]|nr:hypothetical protein MJO29_012720 [Puccinia striiformis f. sp. tritici]
MDVFLFTPKDEVPDFFQYFDDPYLPPQNQQPSPLQKAQASGPAMTGISPSSGIVGLTSFPSITTFIAPMIEAKAAPQRVAVMMEHFMISFRSPGAGAE